MGSFNFFRITGDYLHLAAIISLLVGLLRSRNARTVSLRAQELYLLVYLMRYLDLLEMGGPVSVHNSVFKVLYISITTATIIVIRFYTGDSWPMEVDSKRWYWVVAPAVLYGVFGVMTNSYLFDMWNHYLVLELFWIISQGLEIFAIFPQGWLIYKKQNGQPYVVLWLALMFSYRLFYCLNWLYRKLSENKIDHISIFSGATQVTVFAGIFLYAITVNKRRIRLNPEDNDIEFAEFDAAREEYAFLRASGGSGKNCTVI